MKQALVVFLLMISTTLSRLLDDHSVPFSYDECKLQQGELILLLVKASTINYQADLSIVANSRSPIINDIKNRTRVKSWKYFVSYQDRRQTGQLDEAIFIFYSRVKTQAEYFCWLFMFLSPFSFRGSCWRFWSIRRGQLRNVVIFAFMTLTIFSFFHSSILSKRKIEQRK